MPRPDPALRETPLLSPDDRRARYVRFLRTNDKGFVEFAFGVGSPDLMTELVLVTGAAGGVNLEDFGRGIDISSARHCGVESGGIFADRSDIMHFSWAF